MKQLIFLWLALIWLSFAAMAAEPTPNDVYAEANQVAEEIQIIKRHLRIDKVVEDVKLTIVMTPGHNWQKGYEVLYKINIFRHKNGLPMIASASREPLLKLSPMVTYEQLKRINAELQILKYFLDITETVAPAPVFTEKNPTDVYNLLSKISAELDILNEKTLTPSDALTQAVRVFEDINFILDALNLKNDTIPPKKKPDVQPGDAFENFLLLLAEIQRIQKMIGISGVDFHALKPTNRHFTPSDTFAIGGITLAELQPIKAYLGLKYALTPMAEHYNDIHPSDVQQLVGWSIRKLQLIRFIDKNKIAQ